MRQSMTAALLAAMVAAAGCGNPSPGGPAASLESEEKESGGELKRYAAAELPAVGEPLIPLDQARVQFAPPEGWRVLPRDSRYLARFVKGEEHSALPRITVSAMSAPDGMPDVTEENAAEIAAQMQARSQAKIGRRILERCRPIVLEDRVWSRHVRYVELNRQPCVLQSLETVRDGRLYSIELTAPSAGQRNEDFAEAILAHRDAAYAVAAHWKFLKESREPAEAAIAETKGAKETSPGEENSPGEN